MAKAWRASLRCKNGSARNACAAGRACRLSAPRKDHLDFKGKIQLLFTGLRNSFAALPSGRSQAQLKNCCVRETRSGDRLVRQENRMSNKMDISAVAFVFS